MMMCSNSLSSTGIGKKTLFIFMILTCVYIGAFSQVSINNTNAIPHASSMLDISSNNSGLLIPRMNMSEMTAIASPAEGLLVYVNSGATGLYQYRSGNWEKLFAFSGSLSNGGVLFGSNASFAQDNSHFFWNNTQKYLGLGTNTPNAPLTVSSLLPPTGNGGNSDWIVANLGASSGSRLLFGTREGIPTIGAASSALLAWDTLSLNPGGNVKLPFYAGTGIRPLGVTANGTITTTNLNIPAQNGITQSSGFLKLGGSLTENTNINLNGKHINLQSGGLSVVTTDLFTPTGATASGVVPFAQSFRTETTGILNSIKIRAFTYVNPPVNLQYELIEGSDLSGNVVFTGNAVVPQYGGPENETPIIDLPININVTANQNYVLRLNPFGRHWVFLITESNIYPYGHLFVNGVVYPQYDTRLQITETEQQFNLLNVDTQNKKVSIEGPGKLSVSNLSGQGNRNVIVSPDGTLMSGSGDIGTVAQVSASLPLSVTNSTSTPLISISQSNSSSSGFLSASDWNTFNNKQNLLPNANTSTSGILSNSDWNTFNNKLSPSTALNTIAPLTGGGTLGSPLTLSMLQANTSTNGYLSSTDWNTFNNKYNLPSLSAGSILFSNGSNLDQSNAQLFWNNSTKALGIGTSTPLAGLHINGYEWNNGLKISNNTSGTVGPAVYLEGTNRSYAIISANSGAGSGPQKLGIYDDTAGQYRLVIDSTGNLGLGDINPDKKLVVNGQGGLKVSSSHPGYGYSDWVAGNFGGSGDKRVVIGQFDDIATIGGHNGALDQWRDLAINPNETGNVGIGTTTPNYKLDVNGSQRVTGDLTVTGKVKQSVQQLSISVPAATYPVINPFVGGSTTPTYGETTAMWVHNLGYNPVIMTSFDFSAGGYLHHVNVSYRHVDNDTIEFYFSNASVNVATGLINVIVVN